MTTRATATLPPIKAIVLLALCLTAAPSRSEQEMRTLTDQFGRSVNATILAVDSTTVKIRREDGQEFSLPLANLSDTDQASLKEWAVRNPGTAGTKPAEATASQEKPAASETPAEKPAPKPGSLTLAASRAKFNVDVVYKSEYSKDSYEDWGYSIQLVNTTLHPITDVRVEYNIFSRLYSGSSKKVKAGVQTYNAIGSRQSVVFKTKTARINKWRSMGVNQYGGELYGIWTRLYVGDTLLAESTNPESLISRESWKNASQESEAGNSE